MVDGPGDRLAVGPCRVSCSPRCRAERDGHDFVAAAHVGRVPRRRWWTTRSTACACLVVPDVRAALVALAGVARDRLPDRVVGVTGSVGKTTTKDLLAAVLSAAVRDRGVGEVVQQRAGCAADAVQRARRRRGGRGRDGRPGCGSHRVPLRHGPARRSAWSPPCRRCTPS